MNFNSQARVPTIAVIGGGISGMAAAYTIQEEARQKNRQVKVVLIESNDHLGGKIVTEYIDGLTIEGGPDCFLRQKPWAAQLAAKIGIQNEIIGTNDDLRKVFVVNRGRLMPLPDGVMLIIPTRIKPFALSPLISLPGKIRMGFDWFVPPFKGEQDESIGDFVRRRLGNEALEKIAEPLLSGIHVSDPEKQSLLATFPRFRALEQKHGSLIKGMLNERKLAAQKKPAPSNAPSSIFLSFRDGMGQMVKEIEAAISSVNILCGQPIVRIEKLAKGGFQLYRKEQAPFVADAIILAVPAFDAAQLTASFAPDLADDLKQIRYVSTATISLAYQKSDIRKSFSGFGFVVPSKEKRDISACTWTSIKFNHRAPDDMLLLRSFIGGPGKEEMVELSDEKIIQTVRRELNSLMGLEASPVLTRIYRWEKANPQYDVEHLSRVQVLFKKAREIPGLFLTGSAYEGVGIPDCVNQGQKSAISALEYLHTWSSDEK